MSGSKFRVRFAVQFDPFIVSNEFEGIRKRKCAEAVKDRRWSSVAVQMHCIKSARP